jgi:multiple sugar transport system substrate-binding protein
MLHRYIPILVAAALLLTTACTKSPPQRTLPTPADPGAEQIVVRVGVFFEGNDLNPVIEAYQARHENIKIEKVSFKTGQDLTQAAKEGRIDLFSARGASPGMVRNGIAVDLEPYIRKSQFDTAPFGTTVMDAHRGEGQIHSLPIHGDPHVLVYNKKLVADAKVTIPTDALTWDHLRDIAQKLTRGKGLTKQWGMSTHFYPEYLAYTMALEQAGPGRPVEADQVQSALQYFHTLTFTDESLPPSTGGDKPMPLYYDQGKAAISYVGLSGLRHMAPDKLPGIAPPPAHPNHQPVVLINITSFGIAGGSGKPDAAWDFLSFAAGPEGATVMARAGFFPLYATEAVHQAWLSVTPPPPAGVEPVLKATFYPLPYSYTTGTPFGVYMQAARDVLTGGTTVDLAMRLYRADMAQFK